MVAYVIPRQLRNTIRCGETQQMVCALRRHNPSKGDPMTLYGGMKGGKRVKLLDPDPICTDAQPVLFNCDRDHPEIISGIRIGGVWLSDAEIEGMAVAGGFGVNYPVGTARWRMGDLWQAKHGFEPAYAVLVKWGPCR